MEEVSLVHWSPFSGLECLGGKGENVLPLSHLKIEGPNNPKSFC